jgi:hypothetical protein
MTSSTSGVHRTIRTKFPSLNSERLVHLRLRTYGWNVCVLIYASNSPVVLELHKKFPPQIICWCSSLMNRVLLKNERASHKFARISDMGHAVTCSLNKPRPIPFAKQWTLLLFKKPDQWRNNPGAGGTARERWAEGYKMKEIKVFWRLWV